MRTESTRTNPFTNASMAGNLTSPSISLLNTDKLAIQAVFVGANAQVPSGTFTLQVTNDQTTWTTIAGSASTVSAAGDIMWNIVDLGYPYVRVVYTRTGGDGTLNCTVFTKEDLT